MTLTIITTLCVLILLAYFFHLTSFKTRIPSVILLLALGMICRQFVLNFHISIPDLSPTLPVLGTGGLILIVLEGAFDLEFSRSKLRFIRTTFFTAFIPLALMAIILSLILMAMGYPDMQDNFINVIPLCVISSAIAIPTVKSLSKNTREFVTYESSFSDILGVLFFNFFALNATLGWMQVGSFVGQLLAIILISFLATLILALLISRIDNEIKFIPIILTVILFYSLSKIYHLPGLVIILVFGLILGNLDGLKGAGWIARLNPERLDSEVKKLHHLTVELSFLIRSVFFILFGYLIIPVELFNSATLVESAAVVGVIYLLRLLQLLIFRQPLLPLLFLAPRGLITILLFLSIETNRRIPIVNNSLLIQVIIMTSVIMMAGMMLSRRPRDTVSDGK